MLSKLTRKSIRNYELSITNSKEPDIVRLFLFLRDLCVLRYFVVKSPLHFPSKLFGFAPW